MRWAPSPRSCGEKVGMRGLSASFGLAEAPLTPTLSPRRAGRGSADAARVAKSSRRRRQRLQRLARAPRLPPHLRAEVARDEAGRDVARPTRDGAAAVRGRAGVVQVRDRRAVA